MIARISESKTLKKHGSCNCKFKFDDRKCNSNQKWNSNKFWCECNNPIKHHVYGKDYVWDPSTSACEIDRHGS